MPEQKQNPPSRPPARPLDRDMTEKEKDDLAEQIEEFEGPQRREIRGDNREPADDPGVAHS